MVQFESMDENENPVLITQSEFIRRMKDMSQMGGGAGFYGELPDSYNFVVNSNNKIIKGLSEEAESSLGKDLAEMRKRINELNEQVEFLSAEHSKKKPEEVSQQEKDDLEGMRKELSQEEKKLSDLAASWASDNRLTKQLIDLALLENNMLRGEELSAFIKRSTDLLSDK